MYKLITLYARFLYNFSIADQVGIYAEVITVFITIVAQQISTIRTAITMRKQKKLGPKMIKAPKHNPCLHVSISMHCHLVNEICTLS